MAKEYKENVLTNVEKEYHEYLVTEVQKSPEEIFYDSPKSEFYMVIYDLICDNEETLTNDDYKKLNSKGNKVISSLYDSYSSNEEATLAVRECFFGILTNYIDKQISSNNYM